MVASSERERPCRDDVCLTCSDQVVVARVIELLNDDLAVLETDQGVEVASTALVDVGVGDAVLLHAKEAIAVASRRAG